ncbi:ferritin family protein [candidate division WOR-3 bacterium]|nr:ferritin family protein [candidate division WOR-3 bacterium]
MDKENMLEGLRTALQTELNGIQFYRLAAERTNDLKGKEVFSLLARDEEIHFEELNRWYTAILNTTTWKPSITLTEARTIFKGESPIFSAEIKERIKKHHFEMSALSIGALLEADSIDFYRKMKEDTDDPQAKRLFGDLQKWEQQHLEAITKQMDVLKEDYWAEQHFSPLF